MSFNCFLKARVSLLQQYKKKGIALYNLSTAFADRKPQPDHV